jgi:hypothetical protein
MHSRIAITRNWSDNDLAQLEFEVFDGTSRFLNEVYVSLDWGAVAATALRRFSSQIHGGLFDLAAGEVGPEYAGGSFRARFHWYKPNELLISTQQQGAFFPFKRGEKAAEAAMFLRTEPALLDRFTAALQAFDASDGGQAILECVDLPQ